jgi:hypothetical protein
MSLGKPVSRPLPNLEFNKIKSVLAIMEKFQVITEEDYILLENAKDELKNVLTDLDFHKSSTETLNSLGSATGRRFFKWV